jgi:transcriptional regulator with XRE-family HTH domain
MPDNPHLTDNPPGDSPAERPPSLHAFGTALRARRDALHLTLDALAQLTGISKPYLSNIENARSPGPPSEEKLVRIARALQLPERPLLNAADWLRTPESIRNALSSVSPAATAPGDAAASPPPRRPDGSIDLDAMVRPPPHERAAPAPAAAGSPADPLPTRPVPLISRVAAGRPTEFTDLGYPAGVADHYVAAPDLPAAPTGAAFALRVLGDSMAPEYREGEILIVAPGEPHDGDDCVVRLGELDHFATTFKRIFFLPAEQGRPASLRLLPLNPAYAERTVALEQVSGIYPLLYRLVPPKPAAAESPPPPSAPPRP